MLAYNQLQCAPLVQPARHGWAPRSHFSFRHTAGNRVTFYLRLFNPANHTPSCTSAIQVTHFANDGPDPIGVSIFIRSPRRSRNPNNTSYFRNRRPPPPPVAALAGTTPRDPTVRPRMQSLCPAGRVRRQRRAWPRGRRRYALPVGWPALRRRGGRPRGSRPWRRPCP
jgi:hypothetical protein